MCSAIRANRCASVGTQRCQTKPYCPGSIRTNGKPLARDHPITICSSQRSAINQASHRTTPQRRHTPQTQPGTPPGFSAQDRHQELANCMHPTRPLPGHYPQRTPRHGHRSVAKRHASDPRTACPRGRFRERGGRRHAVLRRCAEARQAASKRRSSTRTPNPHPRPPNRLHTPPLRKRNGVWHAVLRGCAGVPGRRKAKLTTT